MQRLLPFDSRLLPGRQPWLAHRLAWLLGAGLLCCLLGLFMGATTLGVSAAETAEIPAMALPAGAAATMAAVGSEPVLPVCARLPAHDLCIDAEPGDPTDPEAFSDDRQLMLVSYALLGHATSPPLAQATLPPLLRPPRSQG